MKLPHVILLAIVVALAMVTVSASVRAQADGNNAADAPEIDDEKKGESAKPEQGGDDSDSILAMVYESGLTGMAFMGVLALFSMVAGTISVERSLNMRQNNVVPESFVTGIARICRDTKSSKREMLSELCREPGPATTVLSAGLARFGDPPMEVEKAMEDAAAREMAELRSRIRPLAMVGNVSPLVGLLGTVVGMILAFHTASQAGLGKAELLAKGIYMALLTTAGGLSIAIPSMMLASFFGGRIERFFRELDRCLVSVLPHLSGSRHSASTDTVVVQDNPVSAAKGQDSLAKPSQKIEPPVADPPRTSSQKTERKKKRTSKNAAASAGGKSKAESSKAEPSTAEPSTAEPSTAEPSTAERSTAEPSTTESSTAAVASTTVEASEQPQQPLAQATSGSESSATQSRQKTQPGEPEGDGRGPYARR